MGIRIHTSMCIYIYVHLHGSFPELRMPFWVFQEQRVWYFGICFGFPYVGEVHIYIYMKMRARIHSVCAMRVSMYVYLCAITHTNTKA